MTSLGEHVLYFVLVSLATALVTAAIRLRSPWQIVWETARFLATIVIGVATLAGMVFVLEWIFTRPLI